jgi:hypothetical protein
MADLKSLEQQHASALTHDEATASRVEGPAGLGRVVVELHVCDRL